MGMETKSVTKSNALIEAGYRLSLTEMQIVLYGISLINPTRTNFPLCYRVDIARFAEMFNREHGQIYQEVKEAIQKRFWERDFSYKDEDGKIVTNRWLTRIKHKDKTGFIEIKFNEEIQPYLHQLQNRFTTYYIEQIADMKSVYSVRFYELGIMHLNKSKKNKVFFKLSIDAIKKRLELTEKYSRFSNFKAFVLEPAKKEINKHSDIRLHYEVIKQGRKPSEIKFTLTKKDNAVKSISYNSLSTLVFEKAKQIIKEAGTGWDLYAIEQQFHEYSAKKGRPENIEGAFLGFVKKKVAKKP